MLYFGRKLKKNPKNPVDFCGRHKNMVFIGTFSEMPE
jgi:hypothetical protein